MNSKRIELTGNGQTVKCNGRKNEYGEYVVRHYIRATLQPNADYFTDSIDDAHATAQRMYDAIMTSK